MDVIDERLARILLDIAQLFARDREYTDKEVQLWLQHIRPVWKKNPAWMKQGLVNWYAAMQKARLITDGANDMEQFVRDGFRGRKMSESNTTSPGYTNRNRQRVIRQTDLPGTDHFQKVYVLQCEYCETEYGSNGADIFQRRCPKCQGGRPGLATE
jgi:hypothetical protein